MIKNHPLSQLTIRPFAESDWPALWPILQTTIAAGETYTFSPQSTEAEIRKAWVELPAATFVACDASGKIVGTLPEVFQHSKLGLVDAFVMFKWLV